MGIFGSAKLNRSKQQGFIPPAGATPICPHCERTVEGLFTQEVKMGFGKSYIYFCRKCSKVLGVSQRKGFWMG